MLGKAASLNAKLIEICPICVQEADGFGRFQKTCVHTHEPQQPISIGKQVDIFIRFPAIIYGTFAKAIYAKLPASHGRKASPNSEKIIAAAAIKIQPLRIPVRHQKQPGSAITAKPYRSCSIAG